jgi:hypothetical protein
MKTKTHFAFRVDIWDNTGDSIVEHVAGADDFQVASATYRAHARAATAALGKVRRGTQHGRIVRDFWGPEQVASR